MKRRALMGLAFVLALAALVLWNPMERGRGSGGAMEHAAPQAGGDGVGWSAGSVPKIAPEPRSEKAEPVTSAWWNTARAADDDPAAPLPIRKIKTPSGEVRFVSAVMSMEIDSIDPSIDPEAAARAAEEADAAGESSDLDDDHPGSYWKNLGYTSIRAVLTDLGVSADKAWVDSASGQMTVSLRSGQDGGAPGEQLIVLAPESTPGDADGDGKASGLDVARFLKAYGAKSIDADANDDGVVDQRDLVRFLREWSEGAG
jgi:hypothetical protein